MKRLISFLALIIVLSACQPAISTATPTATVEIQATATATIAPTATPIPPTETPALPSIHEGYPHSLDEYTKTGMTDAQFADKWESGYKAYYQQVAQTAIPADAKVVTYGWDIPSIHVVFVQSADQKGIAILSAYTTNRVDTQGRQLEEYWLVVAFKTADGTRVVRMFVGENPNLSGLKGYDVTVQTQKVANSNGHIKGIMFEFEQTESDDIDVGQVLQGQDTSSLYQIIRSSNATIWPKEVEDIQLAGVIMDYYL